jgi:hypothetical protein
MTFEPIDFLWLARRQQAVELGEAEEPDQDIFDLLREEWATLSLAYQGLDPFNCLVAAEDFPGYLTTESSPWRIFVPWPLATSFPGNSVSSKLIAVGSEIGITPVSNLCVSGSSAMLGSNIEIGDLDFCQYVELPPSEIVSVAATFTTPMKGRVLIKARYGSLVVRRPWADQWRVLASEMISTNTIDRAQRFMVDFLGSVAGFGALPMSNVILASDFNDRSRGAAKHSFVSGTSCGVGS